MFEIGRVYNRQNDIHGRYGGQQQGGISTPPEHPYIFLFTSESGEQHGYQDGWDEDGVFVYTGEGQISNQSFQRGNRAIRDHAGNGKDLLLFQSLGKSKGYRYLGEFCCASWEYRQGIDRENNQRQVIVFHLIEAGAETTPDLTVLPHSQESDHSTLRELAYQASTSASEGTEKQAKKKYYERSVAVRSYVLARAEGVCEACGSPAPFSKLDGTPYLEPHHTRRVSDGGPDHPRWVGAICPNCHREIHYGTDGEDKNSKLKEYLGTVENV